MPSKTGRGADQFMLRLPDGMRDRIRAAADANGRSMNAEIVSRLETSFEVDPTETVEAIRERIFSETITPEQLKDEPGPREIVEGELQKAIRATIISTLSRLEAQGLMTMLVDVNEERPDATLFYKLARRDERRTDIHRINRPHDRRSTDAPPKGKK